MVECLTRDRGVVGSSLNGGNALCSSKNLMMMVMMMIQNV